MVVVVAVDGKEYNLGEKEVSVMKYITEAEAMAPGQKVFINSCRLPSLTSTKKHSNSFCKYSKFATIKLKSHQKSLTA